MIGTLNPLQLAQFYSTEREFATSHNLLQSMPAFLMAPLDLRITQDMKLAIHIIIIYQLVRIITIAV